MSEPEMNPDFLQLHALGEYLTGPVPDKYSQHEKELQNRVALAMQRRQYARAELALTTPTHASGNPTPVFLPGVRVEATWKAKEAAADVLAGAVRKFVAAWQQGTTEETLDKLERLLEARLETFDRCKSEHEQARTDFSASTWKAESPATTYFVILNGQRWLFDVERPTDPMPEEDFDLHEWLKWGTRVKPGRPTDEERAHEPVWFTRPDCEGMRLRAYIRANHPHLPKALSRIARTLRVEEALEKAG